MDLLSTTIADTRLQSSLLAHLTPAEEWSIDFERGVGTPCHLVRGAGVWLMEDGLEPLWLDPGDLVMFPRWDHHLLTSDPALEPVKITHWLASIGVPIWRPGELLDEPIRARAARPGKCDLLSMVFRMEAPAESPLIEGLPRRILVRQAMQDLGDLLDMVARFVSSEAERKQPGYAIVSNRLAELLFMQIVRLQMTTGAAETSGLLRGLADPVLARGLAAMHAHPEADWSVARLATACGLSRSVFAERFRELVGRPPGQYLARLRMERAAERLSQGARVKVVAGEAGYATGYAFATAFQRHFGCLPSDYRNRRLEE